jgi:hypothetical protein
MMHNRLGAIKRKEKMIVGKLDGERKRAQLIFETKDHHSSSRKALQNIKQSNQEDFFKKLMRNKEAKSN